MAIIGTAGPDVLSGDGLIFGLAGNDTLLGGEGNDALFGQAGHDRLDGGNGNDELYGGGGNDRLLGNEGDDYVIDRWGDNRIWGGAGNDSIQLRSHDDTIWGGAGDDFVVDLHGTNLAYGGSGNDRLTVAGNTWGGAGDDHALGIIDRADGIVEGTAWGGSGNDSVSGGLRAYGGEGDDFVSVEDVGKAYGGEGNDFINARNARGGNGNDVINVRGGALEALEDPAGAIFRGEAGDDTLVGAWTSDVLWGGEGADTFRLEVPNVLVAGHFVREGGADVIGDLQPEDVVILRINDTGPFGGATDYGLADLDTSSDGHLGVGDVGVTITTQGLVLDLALAFPDLEWYAAGPNTVRFGGLEVISA